MPSDVEGLIGRLKIVPKDAYLDIPAGTFFSTRTPVGQLCHEAADALSLQHFNAPEGKGEAWQPIATHPKTKEPIWAWVKDTDKNAKHKRSSWSLINYRRDKGAYQFYSTTEYHGALLSQVGLRATHWMPLPAPPGQEQQPPASESDTVGELESEMKDSRLTCQHKNLWWGSAGYYILCRDCPAAWVFRCHANDEPEHSISLNLTGDITRAVPEGKE